MNYSTALFLINKNARAIVVAYEPAVNGKYTNTNVLKTLDSSIEVGDLVVVETTSRWNMTIGKVVEVDVEPDFDSHEKMLWIVARVNPDEYAAILKQEQDAVAKIKSAEIRQKREKLAASLLADHETLLALPIATAGGTPALPAK